MSAGHFPLPPPPPTHPGPDRVKVGEEFTLFRNLLAKWMRLFTLGYKSKDCNIVVEEQFN